jgi:tripartite-type tricarboxylate transporter receptor subunit TctC
MAIRSSLIAMTLGIACTWTAHGQSLPTKPLRFVVPFAAGGPADAVAREVGQKLGEELGQTVVVENQGGGFGVSALTAVALAEADGHTLLFAASGNIVLQPQLSKKGGAELLAKLRPVSMVSTGPHMLVISTQVPATTMKEFIDYAKANPGKMSYASAGVGGVAHLGMEYLLAMAKIDLAHIPYKGAAAAMNDLASGQVQAMFSSPPSLQASIDKGYVRPLGMSAAGGTGAAKSLPVIGSTVPGFEFTTWYGVYAPKGTPQPVVDRLQRSLLKVLGNPTLKAKMEAQGIELKGSTPEELAQLSKRDTDKWAKVIRDAKIKLD